MTWFKVDDSFWGHPKQTALSKGAVALWVRAGSWSANLLTDGLVPQHMIGMLGGTKRDVEQLLIAKLWERDGVSFRFHDWTDWQPSREQVEARREAEAKKKADWRAKKAGQRAASPGVSTVDTGVRPGGSPDGVPGGVPALSTSTRPDPTRPDPSFPTGKTPPGGAERMNSGQIVGMWIDSLTRRPPSNVTGQIAKQVKDLVDDKFTDQEILDGLQKLSAKGLHPSTLPSLVNDVVNRPKLTSVNGKRNDGKIKCVELSPGQWREIGQDEYVMGKKTEWR